MAAHLRDEHGNPVELTDEIGRPVKLTDEHGRPIHVTGVAFSSSETTTTTPATGMESMPLGAAAMQGPRQAGPPVHHETLGEVLEGGGQYQPRRDQTEGVAFGGGGGVFGEIKHGESSPSSTSSEGDEGLGEGHEDAAGGRRKKKGIGEKIKEKLMGGKHKDKEKDKDVYQTSSTTMTTTTTTTLGHHEDDHEKKGFMEKIKDKIPGTSHY